MSFCRFCGAAVVDDTQACCPGRVTAIQYDKCLRGEHEATTVQPSATGDVFLPTMIGFLVVDGVKVEVCKHCRCLYVEKG